MKKIGLFYGSSTGNTKKGAIKIQHFLGEDHVDILDVGVTTPDKICNYNNLILGTSTWGSGDLQSDWIDFLHQIDNLELSSKKVALYGYGDAKTYPYTFVDGMALLYNHLKNSGCTFIGQVDADPYSFHRGSDAEINGKFVGLALDEENESSKSDDRITKWLQQLKKDFH